ncbi:MAG: hypothetical protein O2960_15895 [Verrucomicrobia bacterium]|nr:hypothetical protein [Verrucomicrobiota bacterium]
MSKHKRRKERQAEYREMLRAAMDDEPGFRRRIFRTLDHGGLDTAPDGRPIKADFFGAIRDWEKKDPHTSRACLSLVEQVVHRLQIKPVIKG